MKCYIFLVGFGKDTDRMQAALTEFMSRKDTEYDRGPYAVSGDFQVVGTQLLSNFDHIDRYIVPACRAAGLFRDCFLIWAYNPANAKVIETHKKLVERRFGKQYREVAHAFFDPDKKCAYAPAYAPQIKHEWAHLIHGFWHGNETKYG